MIELKFSEEQFEKLLKLVSLGALVINAYREDAMEEFLDVEQYLYSKAEEEELEDLYEYDEEAEAIVPSEEVEDEIFKYLHEYNEEMFWQTLCTRLAMRDLEKELGEETVKKMEFPERLKKISPLFEKYAEEFEKNGVENLVLIKKGK